MPREGFLTLPRIQIFLNVNDFTKNRVNLSSQAAPNFYVEFGLMRDSPLRVPINAVSFSSARTTKRFPSSRCASAIQIVRPRESTPETQPQLQPALLRLSAIISQ
jgi:hypothetical protein